MIKKLLLSLAAFTVLLSLAVWALEIGDGFYLYGRDNDEISKVLDMSDDEIKAYCEQNSITLLAVNSDNTKQIRETERVTEFSKTVGNLAVLSDSEIKNLTADLCGFDNTAGKVIKKDSYKYLKVELKTTDSGGEYILTQYITVKEGKNITLSFYTSSELSTDYCDEIFNSQFKNTGTLKVVITILLAFLFGVAALLSVMIVRDLNAPKKSSENNT